MTGSSVRSTDRRLKPADFEQASMGLPRNSCKDSRSARPQETVSRNVTARRLQELRAELAERDWQIISTLARVRVATAAQIEALHFADVTARMARKRLSSLTDRRVLSRLPRTVGGGQAGSSGYVYALDVAGQRLADLAGGGGQRRPWALGTRFLAHSLAITDIYVRLVLAERSGDLRVARFVGEPASWRTFFGPGGGRLVLKPDAYTVLLVGGYEDHWFLEIDLNTEHAPAIGRKCATYRGYWRSGSEEARTGVFPRVLWLVPDERRSAVVRQVIRRQTSEAAELFDVALLDAVVERVLRGAAL
jgi:hypothetical protein